LAASSLKRRVSRSQVSVIREGTCAQDGNLPFDSATGLTGFQSCAADVNSGAISHFDIITNHGDELLTQFEKIIPYGWHYLFLLCNLIAVSDL
jgi:hypothetical protein